MIKLNSQPKQTDGYWQVKCNDGGEHRFDEQTDVLGESRCVDCEMSRYEVWKRKLCNEIIKLVGIDPYTEFQREKLDTTIKKVLLKLKAVRRIAEKEC